jgi:hypothetical protein
MAFIPIPTLFTAVHCRLSRTFFLAPCSPDGIGGGRVADYTPLITDACRTTCVSLEHPRPYALGDRRLPNPSAGEPADHREGKGRAREASLVLEPMAGEASRRSRCRSWSRTVYAGGEVTR